MDGVAEAKSIGAKIAPTAVGEPVDTEGREAEATVGNVDEELAGAEKFTAFLRSTVV